MRIRDTDFQPLVDGIENPVHDGVLQLFVTERTVIQNEVTVGRYRFRLELVRIGHLQGFDELVQKLAVLHVGGRRVGGILLYLFKLLYDVLVEIRPFLRLDNPYGLAVLLVAAQPAVLVAEEFQIAEYRTRATTDCHGKLVDRHFLFQQVLNSIDFLVSCHGSSFFSKLSACSLSMPS